MKKRPGQPMFHATTFHHQLSLFLSVANSGEYGNNNAHSRNSTAKQSRQNDRYPTSVASVKQSPRQTLVWGGNVEETTQGHESRILNVPQPPRPSPSIVDPKNDFVLLTWHIAGFQEIWETDAGISRWARSLLPNTAAGGPQWKQTLGADAHKAHCFIRLPETINATKTTSTFEIGIGK